MLATCCALAIYATQTDSQTGSKDGASDRVRDVPWMVGGATWYTGIVEAVSEDELVLLEVTENQPPREHRFAPCTVLREGGVIRFRTTGFTYRWEDVKRGDTIMVATKKDRVDGVQYCLEICITRRPDAKLPEGQYPKEDRHFRQRSILNDIDNQLDVSDDEILAVFPKRVDRSDGRVITDGGLTNSYQLKLDAIRAKKAKELKAPSPEKK